MVKNRFRLEPKVLKEFDYKVYYNPKLKALGGQAAQKGGAFLVVADLNQDLPAIISGPSNMFVKRRAKLVVYDEEVG